MVMAKHRVAVIKRAEAKQVPQQATTINRRAVQKPDSKGFNVEAYIKQVFGKDAQVALAVAYAESGRRCNAVGDGHITFESGGQLYGASYGVFQIRHLKGRPSPEQLLDCKTNIDYAFKLFQSSGWYPWSVCKKKVRCY